MQVYAWNQTSVAREFVFFKSAPTAEWVILFFTGVVLALLDVLVFQRLPDSFITHVSIVVLWVVIAAIFNCIVWLRLGKELAFQWCTGYLLELL